MFKRFIISLVLGINISVIAFSVAYTSASDSDSIPYMAALSFLILVILIGLRYLTADSANKGLAKSIITLIPGVIDWSLKSSYNYFILLFLTCVLGFFAFKFGPNSLHKVNIDTGKASYIQFEDDIMPASTTNFILKEIWNPFKTKSELLDCFKCLTSQRKSWSPSLNSSVLECGNALLPELIVNGIDISDLDLNFSSDNRTKKNTELLNGYLENELPKRNFKDEVLIATWNIRELGKSRFGARTKESLYYISSIISHFDIVAIQEASANIEPLNKINELLGDNYGLIYSLVERKLRGNNERMAFFYDKRKVKVGSMVANAVIPEYRYKERILDRKEVQLSRVPFIVTFEYSNTKITLCNSHIYFGRNTGEKRQERINEIARLGKFLVDTKQIEENWDGTLAIMGDLNVPSPNSPEIQSLQDLGFDTRNGLSDLPSDYNMRKPYDQIILLDSSKLKIGKYGVLNLYNHIYRDSDELEYLAEMQISRGYKRFMDNNIDNGSFEKTRNRFYKLFWRTSQLSDHFPKWVQLKDLSNSEIK